MSDTPPPFPVPNYTLFDSTSVGVATLFGSPIAGTALMAANYRRLGKDNNAVLAILVGLLVTAVAVLSGYLIPQGVSGAIAISLFIATRNAAKSLQGPAIDQHVNQGGKLASRWLAFGAGLAALSLIVGGVVGFEVLRQGPKVTIGTKDEIYYSGTATKEDAQALGDALKTIGYLSDKGVTVLLSKGPGGAVASFVVKQDAWNQTAMVAGFEEIGRQIAAKIGGFPIKVRLIDSERETKKELTVGKSIIGTKDEIYYFGSATEADAKALGQALKTDGFFSDRGVTVLLSKGDGTAISFVVKEGFWDNPAGVADFERIVRHAAASIGGLPLKLRLLNPTLETKKEIMVQ